MDRRRPRPGLLTVGVLGRQQPQERRPPRAPPRTPDVVALARLRPVPAGRAADLPLLAPSAGRRPRGGQQGVALRLEGAPDGRAELRGEGARVLVYVVAVEGGAGEGGLREDQQHWEAGRGGDLLVQLKLKL